MDDIAETSVNTSIQENNEEMEVVTMVDVLNEERELEEDANAVLGGSDAKNCTYSEVNAGVVFLSFLRLPLSLIILYIILLGVVAL